MDSDAQKNPYDEAYWLRKLKLYAETYRQATGTKFSSMHQVTDAVLLGLAHNLSELGKPLCPCNFYPDKKEEVKSRRWLCPCDEMQIHKYCHCLLYLGNDDLPITEHLPEDHEGRQIYGLLPDPTQEQGRAWRDRSDGDIRAWHKK